MTRCLQFRLAATRMGCCCCAARSRTRQQVVRGAHGSRASCRSSKVRHLAPACDQSMRPAAPWHAMLGTQQTHGMHLPCMRVEKYSESLQTKGLATTRKLAAIHMQNEKRSEHIDKCTLGLGAFSQHDRDYSVANLAPDLSKASLVRGSCLATGLIALMPRVQDGARRGRLAADPRPSFPLLAPAVTAEHGQAARSAG